MDIIGAGTEPPSSIPFFAGSPPDNRWRRFPFLGASGLSVTGFVPVLAFFGDLDREREDDRE